MKSAGMQKPSTNMEGAVGAMSVKCAFCDGTGEDPFELLSKLARCPVCKGHKTLDVKWPAVACAYCRGTGRQRHARLPCSGCQGAGLIALGGPATQCPQCGGTGREPEADLPCSLCKGAGLVAKKAAQDKPERVTLESHGES